MNYSIKKFLKNFVGIENVQVAIIMIIFIAGSLLIALNCQHVLSENHCDGFSNLSECLCNKDCLRIGYSISRYDSGNIFRHEKCICSGQKGVQQIW